MRRIGYALLAALVIGGSVALRMREDGVRDASFLFFMGLAAIVAMAIVAPGLFSWGSDATSWGGKSPVLQPESHHVVSVGDDVIRVEDPSGDVLTLPVGDLQEVMIATNDTGPIGIDLWWQLSGGPANQVCRFPGGATGEEAVLRFVQQLPGFDNEQFIRAMGSTSKAQFICWRAAAHS